MAVRFRLALMLTAALGMALSHSAQAEAHGVESSLRYFDAVSYTHLTLPTSHLV